jgi:hypothetical protein
MKYISLLIILLFLNACRTQLVSQSQIAIIPVDKPHQAGVQGPNFQGNLFKASYPEENFYHRFDSVSRFTPTQDDLAAAETILNSFLKKKSRFKLNLRERNIITYTSLPNYFRQYVGFVNKKGERIININFYWNHRSISQKLYDYSIDSDSRLNYNSGYTTVLDGGSAYGAAEINLTEGKLISIGVNRVG